MLWNPAHSGPVPAGLDGSSDAYCCDHANAMPPTRPARIYRSCCRSSVNTLHVLGRGFWLRPCHKQCLMRPTAHACHSVDIRSRTFGACRTHRPAESEAVLLRPVLRGARCDRQQSDILNERVAWFEECQRTQTHLAAQPSLCQHRVYADLSACNKIATKGYATICDDLFDVIIRCVTGLQGDGGWIRGGTRGGAASKPSNSGRQRVNAAGPPVIQHGRRSMSVRGSTSR